MKRWPLLSAAVLVAAATSFSLPTAIMGAPALAAQTSQSAAGNLEPLALEATGEDATKAAEAIKTLRESGYAGLNALLSLKTQGPHFKNAVDQVAMQKDASVSRLYWYTDLAAAKAEAQRTGKPILTLRMLGKLNEDLSCANSRFFRTTLYANAEISAYLREHFILHWESVRPVPVVTIDMGDGRKLVRTITGNSIHYVLDAKGRVVDGIPGLYGTQAFLKGLKAAESVATAMRELDDAGFVAAARGFHQEQMLEIRAQWQGDLEKVGAKIEAQISMKEVPTKVAPPTAMAASKIAVGKTVLEKGMLQMVMSVPDAALEKATDEETWLKVAALHGGEARLDKDTIDLMRKKVPAEVAMKVAMSKRIVEDPMMKMVRNLQDSIALDTVKNEYQLHLKIHEWLGQSAAPADLKQLNERIYADLFLTPSSDPWLGLAPADVFSAIDDGGVCKVPGTPAAH